MSNQNDRIPDRLQEAHDKVMDSDERKQWRALSRSAQVAIIAAVVIGLAVIVTLVKAVF